MTTSTTAWIMLCVRILARDAGRSRSSRPSANICSEARVIAKVLGWLGFGSHGQGHREHDHHGHDHAYGHKHGVVDPTIATTDRGIWAIKWSFLILAATAVLQLIVVFVSH